jgi:HAE1 family hydrophobic/amphiphilic exporter-1
MNLSLPFIKRPVMTTLVVLAVLFSGLVSYEKLPVSALPNVEYPVIVVTSELPGASPQTMASSVSTPLERAFMSVSGIQEMTSSSTQGKSVITLSFSLDTNIDIAAQDINAQISATQPLLPQNMPRNPTYQKFNPSEQSFLYLLLTSKVVPRDKLFEYANNFIGNRLSTIPGVAEVKTYGNPFAVRVQMDLDILAARKLDLTSISSSVIQGNSNQPIGNFDGPTRYFLMNSDGRLYNAKEFNNVIVNYKNNAAIRIKDLGFSIDALKDDTKQAYYINKNVNEACVLISLKKQRKANTLQLSESVKNIFPELQQDIPKSINLKIIYDQAPSIIESIDDVKFTLILAFLLVVVIIYIYLGKFTDTIIPILVIPMSIIGTFLVMYILGYSLDNLSLLALTLAIGFVIDDAIVVLENIVRRVEQGESPYQASVEGSKQISTTVLSMTICLSAVFIPLLFLEGILGRFFHEFSLVIIICILFSGVISLTLTPMLCSRFIPKRNKIVDDKKGTPNFSEKLNRYLISKYSFILKKVLDKPLPTFLIGFIFLFFTFYLFTKLPTTLVDKQDIGFINATSTFAPNSSSRNTIQSLSSINEILTNDPYIEDFTAVGADEYNKNTFFIRLKDIKERPGIETVIKQLTEKTKKLVNCNTQFSSIPLINLSIGGKSGQYQYVISGLNPDVLIDNAQKFTDYLKTVSGFKNVTNDLDLDTPEIFLNLDRKKIASYGLTPGVLQQVVALAYGGNRVSNIQTPINQYDVIIEVLPKFKTNPLALTQFWLKIDEDKVAPMADMAEASQKLVSASINHYNQLPAVTVSFDTEDEMPLSKASTMLDSISQSLLMPGCVGQIVGKALEFEKTINSLNFLLIMAVIFIYLILGILYESFILPITVLSALPIAILGGLVTLVIFNEILSLYALVGLMLLIGIVQKNGIILVDYANEITLMEDKTPKEAIYEACVMRFRPILMTTIAAIMGAIPIALGLGAGGDARRPLGLVIVGGLFFSQLVTLFLTPVTFLYFDSFQLYLEKKLKKIRFNHNE